jgi:hypothetical protein
MALKQTAYHKQAFEIDTTRQACLISYISEKRQLSSES